MSRARSDHVSRGEAPPAAAVEHNRWPDLDVADLGAWTPQVPVSVVLPCRDVADALERTLAALAVQSYPAELLEVVVADDGSDPAIDAARLRDALADQAPEVTVVRQERVGFGAGRARNRGADQASGEILVFLDADTILEPRAIEAHARWHHAASDVVVLGSDRNVDVAGVDAAAILAAGADGIAPMVAGREIQSPGWIVDFLARREQLTTRHGDLFAILTSRNVSVRAGLFADVGRFTTYGIRGIEDTELAWRLFAAGALFVPDPEAFGWHQGTSHLEGRAKAATKRRRTPLLHHAIPARIIRPPDAARRFAVPRVVVRLDATGRPLESVVEAVESVLGGRHRDVGVHLSGVDGHPDETLLRETFDADARVLGLDGATPPRFCEVIVDAPASARFGPTTLETLVGTLERKQVGRVVAALPQHDPAEQAVVACTSRAVAKARRVAADRGRVGPEALAALAVELFGDWWLASTDTDLTVAGHPPPDDGAEPPSNDALRTVEHAQRAATHHRREAHTATQRADRAEQRLARTEERLARTEERLARTEERLARTEERLARTKDQLESLRSRRAVRVADAVGRRVRKLRRRA